VLCTVPLWASSYARAWLANRTGCQGLIFHGDGRAPITTACLALDTMFWLLDVRVSEVARDVEFLIARRRAPVGRAARQFRRRRAQSQLSPSIWHESVDNDVSMWM
jgi:hypothetical protein